MNAVQEMATIFTLHTVKHYVIILQQNLFLSFYLSFSFFWWSLMT